MNSHITPKDFFLHIGATIALYVVAGSLINLCFSIINYFNPDSLASYFYSNSIAWPISMLIVLVPALYFVEWFIRRDLVKNSGKKEVWIRRWRIYLTIFLASVLLIGDLIVLINVYLGGEITSRFVYKILVIILVAGAIGKYYFFDLYDKYARATLVRQINSWFGIIFVLAAVITGFIVVGSPAKQRALRFDQQRTNDLSTIQWYIINNWQNKGKLPATLTELNDPLSGTTVPKDPETEAPYEYIQKGSNTFELCATFGQSSQDLKGRGESGYGRDIGLTYPSPSYYPGIEGEQWNHESGRTCFSRTIDPSKYPVNTKTVNPEMILK